MSPIRVVLIEDHDLTRVGMKITLQQQGIEVIGEATTAAEGVSLVESLQPDVVIVDLGLPDADGVEVTRRLKGLPPEKVPRVLILTLTDTEETVLAAFAAGADSYCIKDTSSENLLQAIRLTAEGNSWVDPAIAKIVLNQVRKVADVKTVQIEASDPEYKQILASTPLTERELEVLTEIVNGYSNAQIAERLYITVGTVKTHVRNILNKLCADDRTQAAVRALRSGLVK
ncbi:MAG: response regulator transcription factor [Pseudanabaenaceae cyanobacterium SKYGB_i_bin29]|nr:response regulator transcription factor [Pseudanabaenaceae cyanobacterium SKYG29]MDW8420445.1 response regulator transcription factor [Pseudanabaenaceae cyanobacterium SKYGB_i_bin29]